MGKNLHALVTNKVTYVHGKERRFYFCSLLSKDYYSATYITIIDISIWQIQISSLIMKNEILTTIYPSISSFINISPQIGAKNTNRIPTWTISLKI